VCIRTLIAANMRGKLKNTLAVSQLAKMVTAIGSRRITGCSRGKFALGLGLDLDLDLELDGERNVRILLLIC